MIVKNKIRLAIVVLLIIATSGFLYFKFSNKFGPKNNPQTGSPPQTLAQNQNYSSSDESAQSSTNLQTKKKKSLAAPGRQTYSITTSHRSPQLYKAVIDPEDVRVGETQTMTVYVKERKEKNFISTVVAEIQTDKEKVKHPLELKSGTDQDGVWEGSWVVHDTHDTTYITTFIAKNNLGEISEARLSWTDPGCSCTGTDCTVSGSCTVSGVDGADGGTMTITGTVTVPAATTLVYGATLNVSGTLNVNNTGVLQGGNICMTDADSDNYIANTTQYAESTCGTNRRRRYLMASITATDCTDSIATYWQNITCYEDADHDDYRTNYFDTCCAGANCSSCSNPNYLADASTPSGDCNDSCATCYPGSTAYTTSADGKDQDCDGSTDENDAPPTKTCYTDVYYRKVCKSGAQSGCNAYCGATGSLTYASLLPVQAESIQNLNFSTCSGSGTAYNCDPCLKWDTPSYGDYIRCTCAAKYR